MDDDQQFCLRWNNHQSTLISVFDTLLENETLVDCTLAAEGKYLKAHKVVLSACSPYFATLLQEQHDKHPIFILKDVKYQELRAMMDYMYRGEVNISQDQLAALLKAAESLQIKGLSDNRSGSVGGTTAPKPEQQQQQQQQQQQHHRAPMPTGKLSAGYTLEQTKRARIAGPGEPEIGSREGSSSPSRRRRKVRRRSIENAMTDIHENSNSSQRNTQQQIPHDAMNTMNTMNTDNTQGPASATIAATGSIDAETSDVAATVTDKSNHKQMLQPDQAKDTLNAGVSGVASSSDLVIEPKAEYNDEANDEPVEDLTLDEEDMGMDDLDQNAGTSQGGEGSSQGYAPCQHDRSQDELLLSTQEAQQRDPQVMSYKFSQTMIEGGSFVGFNKKLNVKTTNTKTTNTKKMNGGGGGGKRHSKVANGGKSRNGGNGRTPINLSDRFHCSVCAKSYLRKRHLQRHMRDECIGIPPRFSCDLCPSRFRRKYHMVRHLTSKHGIPPNIAQQTTGNSNRQNSNSYKAKPGSTTNLRNCDNGLPENLTTRKEYYEHAPHQLHHQHYSHHNQQHHYNMNIASPSHMMSGDSGSDCNGSRTAGNSPIPQAHRVPMPTYGLTGAITAISAAAAHVEEKDAKILLEAAAAAAQAAAANHQQSSHMNAPTSRMAASPLIHDNNENAAENQMSPTITGTIATTPNNGGEASTSAGMNMLDEEWKMKLSLQLISNSLLKERLMNTMPYAYKNN